MFRRRYSGQQYNFSILFSSTDHFTLAHICVICFELSLIAINRMTSKQSLNGFETVAEQFGNGRKHKSKNCETGTDSTSHMLPSSNKQLPSFSYIKRLLVDVLWPSQ